MLLIYYYLVTTLMHEEMVCVFDVLEVALKFPLYYVHKLTNVKFYTDADLHFTSLNLIICLSKCRARLRCKNSEITSEK